MTLLRTADVLKLAELSSLKLSPQEAEALLIDLQNIISYVDQLNTVALTPQTEPVKNCNVFRQDMVQQQSSAPLMAQAPEREDTYFVVPKVVDSSKDAQ